MSGLGCRVWGCWVQSEALRVGIRCMGTASGLFFNFQGSGFLADGSGFRVQGSGCMVEPRGWASVAWNLCVKNAGKLLRYGGTSHE